MGFVNLDNTWFVRDNTEDYSTYGAYLDRCAIMENYKKSEDKKLVDAAHKFFDVSTQIFTSLVEIEPANEFEFELTKNIIAQAIQIYDENIIPFKYLLEYYDKEKWAGELAYESMRLSSKEVPIRRTIQTLKNKYLVNDVDTQKSNIPVK